MTGLLQQLVETGLLQFGRFAQPAGYEPILLNLDLLPAYPDVLRLAATNLQSLISGSQAERLLCSADSLPLGVAVSLQSGIPLVYSRGANMLPAFDLVGAYDIGHPTLLLTNTTPALADIETLVKNARRVGLDVIGWTALIDRQTRKIPEGIPTQSLLYLTDIVEQLLHDQFLPPGQAQAVLTWIKERAEAASPPRPDSAAP